MFKKFHFHFYAQRNQKRFNVYSIRNNIIKLFYTDNRNVRLYLDNVHNEMDVFRNIDQHV